MEYMARPKAIRRMMQAKSIRIPKWAWPGIRTNPARDTVADMKAIKPKILKDDS